MATYIEINNERYPASITGRLNDRDWDNRESKAIEVEMTYAEAIALFTDDVAWNIIQENEFQREVIDEEDNVTFETVVEEEVYDNSDYCIAGDIIDHRNGKVTIKMGKPTAEELLALLEEVM